MPGIVSSDEFIRRKKGPDLPLVWQWNHNPNNNLWSVRQRPGYLRLTTGRIDSSILQAKNTLTQRTFGPQSSAVTSLDATNMKEGDCAGLLLLQKDYGFIGVKVRSGKKAIVVEMAKSAEPVEVPFDQNVVFLKADCDFKDRSDKAYFYYSLDGISWKRLGPELKMSYTIPHFMGYRFGLFNYATKVTGGYADFDYFSIENK